MLECYRTAPPVLLSIPLCCPMRLRKKGHEKRFGEVAKGCINVYYTAKKEGSIMATALKLSNELVELARPHAAAEHRSIPKQIEHWARLGKLIEDNPDMPLQFIKDTLLSIEEANVGQHSAYQFDTK